MRTIETTVFKYSELSGSAQSAAREWYRRDYELDTEFVIDDAETAAGILGIEFDRFRNRNSARPAVYWSGFWGQGDGASFTGSWSYAKGSVARIVADYPQDAELHRIARALRDAARVSFYRASARVTVSGHYSHSHTMRVEGYDCTDETADNIADALRSFADWIYRQLEAEYDHQTSDDAVSESIDANGYEFDENGEPA